MVNLSGSWTTGSTGEPAAERIVAHPRCNYTPPYWAIEQSGDTVRAWKIPESYAKGTRSTEPVASIPLEGWVSGVDVVIGPPDSRYVLRYDSVSGHLRGTLKGEPFWAVRVDIVHPGGCIPVP